MNEATLYDAIRELVNYAFKPEFGGRNIYYLQKHDILLKETISSLLPPDLIKEFQNVIQDLNELLQNIEFDMCLIEQITCARPDYFSKVKSMIEDLLYDVSLNPSIAKITKKDGIYKLEMNNEIVLVKEGMPPEVKYQNDMPLEDLV